MPNALLLPPGFAFHQANLQDFSDCRRRFYLRYVRQLAWPAAESEPIEENELWMRQGETFHRLVHQYWLGVPPERLTGLAAQEPLASWWQSFLLHAAQRADLNLPGARRLPEYVLSAPWEGLRLLAKFDLLVVGPDGRLDIFDWKTARRRPRRSDLQRRLQTRVYPLVLALSERGQSSDPTNIRMTYWFTGFPEQPETFEYSAAQYQADLTDLRSLTGGIQRLLPEGESAFPLTQDEKRCAFCVYRSLCGRGRRAGEAGDWEAAESDEETGAVLGPQLSLEQIAEIEF